MRNRHFASGAAVAGVLLCGIPILELFLGGSTATGVRAIVGSCGLALLALSAAIHAGRVRI
jgi:hypothetical protein